MANTTRALILFALGALAAACSSSGGGSTAPSTPAAEVSRDDYAQRLAEWLCDDLAACCNGTGETVDRAACVEVKRKAELHRLASEESHGSRAFDGAVAAECVAALDEAPTSCGAERRVRRCFQTYDGVAALGEPCSGKVQCQGAVTGDVACVAGRCTERLPAGERCEDLPDDVGRCDVCRGDARCRQATSDGQYYCYSYTHLPRGVAGDRCVKDLDPYAFPPDQSPEQSVVFADCSVADGLMCSDEGVCVPVGGLGEACSFGFYCESGLACERGTCVPGLPAGARCESARTCGAGLYCRWTETVCDARDPVTGRCLGETLVAGVCSAPSGEGEACGEHVRCADALVCSSFSAADDGQCVRQTVAECTQGIEKLARQSSKVN